MKHFAVLFAFATKFYAGLRLFPTLFSASLTRVGSLRLTGVFVMIALLSPMFLINPMWKVAAQTSLSTAPPAPIISVPPQVFRVADSNASFSSSFAVNVSNWQIFDLFKSEQLPAGFEAAKISSFGEKALALAENSIVSALAPVFGLVANSSSKNSAASLLSQPVGSVDFDFDGDGKADAARRHSATAEWKIKNSSSGNFSTVSIGSAGSIIAPGDFDGDGKTDAAVFAAGTWTIKKSSNGQTQTISLGQAGDKPVGGDYDGDGLDDAAVFRASNATWYILQSSNSQTVSSVFGQTGDLPVVGNYDGDARADIAVFRPATGYWHILGSSSGYFGLNWGVASDIPVAADYDGDGKTDFAVYRGATGTWFVYKSSTNNGAFLAQTWGNYGDQPVPADYDNDGKADFAVWRPATGVWHIIKSSDAGYQYHTLGQTGDQAISSAYLKQIGGVVQSYDLAKARLSPKNAGGGTDLYSRNFGWSGGLVGLSGRAGMGAGFGISYNSLVWTKQTDQANNASVYFDVDNSNISPGFRFGFPIIEPVYWNKDASRFSYLMVTPSGARVEFRQKMGASGIYETADSSYAQLKIVGATNPNEPVGNFAIQLAGTDGGTMTYLWKAGAFRCSQIKDRNGNFITINHDEQGLLRTVTDTLGRIITVNYDSELYPTTITQIWKNNNGQGANVTQTWATFSYTNKTINPNFDASINVVGPPNGTSLRVLQKITYPGGNAVDFTYNDYGQVWKIRNIAADSPSHVLTQVRTNLETPTANQTDCPRFSETRNWTENFNQDQNGAAQETVVTNSIQTGQTYNVGGISGTATRIEVAMANHPHNASSKTFVGESGWMESLPIATEDWANGTSGTERKRWTWTNWTQDDPNLSEILNPRVIESKVGDPTNTKRSTMEYYTIPLTNEAVYGLVKEAAVYDTNQTTVLKKAVTEYNLDNAYTSRRIIGLPSKTEVYGLETSGLNLMSKATFAYDEENFAAETNQIIAPIQHDTANFGAAFIIGRANLSSTTRWNTEFPNSQSEAVTSKMRYDVAGSPVAALDPLNRKVKTDYTDAFNDNQNRNTFAFPTTLTDPANNFSTVKYRFDTGANVWAKSPAPHGNTNGKETARIYDALGRLERETILNTGAYTRYEYPLNQIQSKVFSTVIDTNNNGADQADEVMSEAWTDGAGRTLRARTEHPNSTVGFSGTLTKYDRLGQVTRSSVPTEINSNYEPAGDDQTRGWLWTSAEYDWKGRVTREINTDGTDKLYNYDGCGCAGGQVTTVQSESVPRDDIPNQTARRTQKIYADILGRSYKTEVLNWDAATPYTTTVQSFNGRDQIINTRQYAGAANSSIFQNVSMNYDGHGRLKHRQYPIEDQQTGTTWIYNADDSIQQTIDPRNVITNFAYNDPRGLTTQISYSVPNNSPIPLSPTANFAYDSLGNRTQMTDGTGIQTYTYDQLSRMTSETKTFSGLAGNFTLSYSYHIGGGLKSYTDPFNAAVNYTNDKLGRLIAVTGTAFGDNTSGNYADAIDYRSFGAVKQMNLKTDDNNQMTMQYDNRLRVQSHQTTSAQGNAPNGFVQKAEFLYFNDSSPQAMTNQVNTNFNRAFKYDHAGRLKENVFGNGYAYSQTIGYDAFSQITNRDTTHWNNGNNVAAAFIAGRKQPTATQIPVYDAAGNLLNTGTRSSGGYQRTAFDAANRTTESATRFQMRRVTTTATHESLLTYAYDGDGRAMKHSRTAYRITTPPQPQSLTNEYQVWSSVLGNAITQLNHEGVKKTTKILAGGAVIAEQIKTSYNERVEWIAADPVTGSSVRLWKTGAFYDLDRKEYEPLGQEINPVEPLEMPGESTGVSLRTADEPEWLCDLHAGNGTSFFDLPVHCKIGQLESGDLNLKELYSAKTENNPNLINTLTDSPLPSFNYSASDEMMNYARASSSKQQDKDKPKKRKRKPVKAKEPLAVIQSEPASNQFEFIDASKDLTNGTILGKYNYFKSFIEDNVKFVGDPNGLVMQNRSGLINRLAWLVGLKSCNDVFKKELGKTPYELIKERGLYITDYDSLNDPQYSQALGISESDRQGVLEHRDKNRPYASTTPDLPVGIITVFNEKEINVSWLYGFVTQNPGQEAIFNESVPHEMIHGAGMKTNNFPGTLFSGHDLNNWQPYNKVINNCIIPGGKRVF